MRGAARRGALRELVNHCSLLRAETAAFRALESGLEGGLCRRRECQLLSGPNHGAVRATEAPDRLSIANPYARTARQAPVETHLEMCNRRVVGNVGLTTRPISNRERKHASSELDAAAEVIMEGSRKKAPLGTVRPFHTPSLPSHLTGRIFGSVLTPRDVRVSLQAARGPCASATQAPPRILFNHPRRCTFESFSLRESCPRSTTACDVWRSISSLANSSPASP